MTEAPSEKPLNTSFEDTARSIGQAAEAFQFLKFIASDKPIDSYGKEPPEFFNSLIKVGLPYFMKTGKGAVVATQINQRIEELSPEDVLKFLADMDPKGFAKMYNENPEIKASIQKSMEIEISEMKLGEGLKLAGISLDSKAFPFVDKPINELKKEDITNLTNDQTKELLYAMPPSLAQEVLDGLAKDKDTGTTIPSIQVPKLGEKASPAEIKQAIDKAIEDRQYYEVGKTLDPKSEGSLSHTFWNFVGGGAAEVEILKQTREAVATRMETAIKEKTGIDPKLLEPEAVHAFIKENKDDKARKILEDNMELIRTTMKKPENQSALIDGMLPEMTPMAIEHMRNMLKDFPIIGQLINMVAGIVEQFMPQVQELAQSFSPERTSAPAAGMGAGLS